MVQMEGEGGGQGQTGHGVRSHTALKHTAATPELLADTAWPAAVLGGLPLWQQQLHCLPPNAIVPGAQHRL